MVPRSGEILFSPYALGPNALKNRVVMSPMTRSRSINNIPGTLVAQYYAQRAEAGLIITEGTSPSPNGLGYARIPGLFSTDQKNGWQVVTDMVHRAGSKIFVQLMHTGRVSHPLNLPPGARVMAPSAVSAGEKMWTDQQGEQALPVPAEMSASDIDQTIVEYVKSAQLAINAGFDGVELHGANGYLIDQFLNTASNKRNDAWGGSVENRIRFAGTIAARVANAIGGDRLGIRLSPYGVFNSMQADPQIEDVYEQLAARLQELGLVYIHIVDHSSMGAPEVKPSVRDKIRSRFKGTIILSGGYNRQRAEADLAAKKGELVAFGRPFISNPKLVSLMKRGGKLVEPDFGTFYTPGEKGYTDYPVLS